MTDLSFPSHAPPPDESPGKTLSGGSGHRFDTQRHWAASLSLGFRARDGRTRMTRARHHGPLRVQRPFYPESGRIDEPSYSKPPYAEPCHVYLLHPPGGLVSGDELRIDIEAESGAHALLTTPAATKLYRADSHGVSWGQHTHLAVRPGALLEWLPQETLCFDGARGVQSTTLDVQGDGRCVGWEVLALGRPASQLPFVSGRVEQRFALTRDGRPLWIERQPLDPMHSRFHGYWGQGRSTVQATLWAVGFDDPAAAVEALRQWLPASRNWAVTQRLDVLLLRYLGDERNAAWEICQQAWELLRPWLSSRQASVPRIWMT
ncbi:urease accessory protein UreD [Chromohalobacter canadensis]|uniref:Urease accessory protein UreD n=1 Tax=Chromohalobacter canadensis TaxID=141389 RepID=A0ABZ0YCS6_9GAMM|nr:urease accessory protein UreD [Chromohalobacter canadensis]MCK0769924.1 urease accessory protein UreD [Chromohalobacter canadensis]WQH09513.1 urease accessory protein UreD [Chromohalobacter canadensis]